MIIKNCSKEDVFLRFGDEICVGWGLEDFSQEMAMEWLIEMVRKKICSKRFIDVPGFKMACDIMDGFAEGCCLNCDDLDETLMENLG